MTIRRGLLMAVITIAGGIGICLIFLELGLRLFLPQPLGVSYRSADSVPVHTPNFPFHYQTSEFDIHTRFNSLGLRDREYPVMKEEGVFRILVLGDSITEALQVPDAQVYTEILEASLNHAATGPHYEVINAGISGFGTGDELKMFEYLGAKLSPDLVIVQMSLINDLSENLYCRWYRVENGRVISSASETVTPLLHLVDFLGSRFHVVQLFRHAFHVLAGKKSVRLRKIAEHKKKYHALLYRNVGSESDFENDWRITFAYLRELHDRVRSAGAKMVLLLRPLDADISSDHKGDYPRNIVARFCEEEKIPVLDLTPLFKERSSGDIYAYRFRKDSHWTQVGHRWAAEGLYRFLIHEARVLSTKSGKRI